jgi:hypothetical protein
MLVKGREGNPRTPRVLRYLKSQDALRECNCASKISLPRFDLKCSNLMSYIESRRRLRYNVKNFSLPGQWFELGPLESWR